MFCPIDDLSYGILNKIEVKYSRTVGEAVILIVASIIAILEAILSLILSGNPQLITQYPFLFMFIFVYMLAGKTRINRYNSL